MISLCNEITRQDEELHTNITCFVGHYKLSILSAVQTISSSVLVEKSSLAFISIGIE